MATCGAFSARWMPYLVAILTLAAPAAASAQQATLRQPATTTPAKAPAGAPAMPPVPVDESARTRFIIGLERAADVKVTALPSSNRVLIDLPQMRLDLPNPPGDTPVGMVKAFQLGV